MDTHNLFLLNMRFNHVNKAFLYDFMYPTMLGFGKSFWVFVSTVSLHLLGFIFKHILRIFFDGYGKTDSNSSGFSHGQEHQIISRDSQGLISSGGNENSEFLFGFLFQFGEDFEPKIPDTESSVSMENGLTVSTSKYMFASAKDIGGFMAEPKEGSFIVEELFVGSNEGSIDNQENQNSGVNIDEVFQELGVEEKIHELVEGSDFSLKGREDSKESEKIGVVQTGEKTEESLKAMSFGKDEGLEGKEGLGLGDQEVSKKEQVNWLADNFLNTENFGYGFGFLSEDEFSRFDSKLESDNSSDGSSISNGDVESGDLEFFPDGDANEEVETHISIVVDEIKGGFIDKVPSLEEIDGGEDEFIEFDPNLDNPTELVENNPVLEDCNKCQENEQTNDMAKTRKLWDLNYDEEEDSDALLEHEVLIEQMKMELKNLRTGGLPTILEEFEMTKMMEGLKPFMKIDEKLEHGDRMEEVQKFYKSYADKMRKLDVLNYQTLQAISFLQMKHPVQSISGENSSFSAVKSLLLPNFWPSKLRRIYAAPTLKFITEMQRDLELVYVGQVCLSWEILRWQFGKAKEFQDYDPEGLRSYNQVAGEFQQFQVLVQRFTEDEPFQGPRMLSYVKKRCSLRSLLHVPTIRDDCVKDKKGKRQEEEYAISMAMLADIIEESMRVFWEFLSADKNDAKFISKFLSGPQANLHDSADLEHFMDIKTSLQKKEKRLKDIVRTGNCLVKKLQKHHHSGRLDRTLFLSQVELRLVSRVLSLPRLTRDQLIWCRTKLNNINFVDRKIHIEPLFLLFPC